MFPRGTYQFLSEKVLGEGKKYLKQNKVAAVLGNSTKKTLVGNFQPIQNLCCTELGRGSEREFKVTDSMTFICIVTTVQLDKILLFTEE